MRKIEAKIKNFLFIISLNVSIEYIISFGINQYPNFLLRNNKKPLPAVIAHIKEIQQLSDGLDDGAHLFKIILCLFEMGFGEDAPEKKCKYFPNDRVLR